jgi:hypothetical protein
MEWRTVKDVAVGLNRVVNGEWRVIADEMETKIEARSNGLNGAFTIQSALDPNRYETVASLLIKCFYSAEPRPHVSQLALKNAPGRTSRGNR